MTVLFNDKEKAFDNRFATASQTQRLPIKPQLQQQIQAALQATKNLPPDACLKEIEHRLLAIQAYYKSCQKTFVVVEEKITCDQYELGGCSRDTAMLFRGSNQETMVIICITAKGSLLHYNTCSWTVYRNAGDVYPIEHSTKMLYNLCRL